MYNNRNFVEIIDNVVYLVEQTAILFLSRASRKELDKNYVETKHFEY